MSEVFQLIAQLGVTLGPQADALAELLAHRRAQGAADERARVVAWMRKREEDVLEDASTRYGVPRSRLDALADAYGYLAVRIDRGDHAGEGET